MAWPNQPDLNIIAKLPMDMSGLIYGSIATEYSTFSRPEALSIERILKLPPPGSHPTLIARKLLMLGTLLQGIPNHSSQSLLSQLSTSYLEIMSRAVATAKNAVLCNDDLVSSIEGIECVAMEGMYQNNAGNVRRAWMANRRAMLIAQMMNLHLGNRSSSHITHLDPKDEGSADLERMWFRLVQTDRYLSLMLGLPPHCFEDNFATPEALENCTPMECMQRLECHAAGLLLRRNQTTMHDLSQTQKIDLLLQRASTFMPPQWWLTPDLPSSSNNASDAFHETMRFVSQFAHHHLAVQLHLPYLLCYSTDHEYDYHKIAAVNASREVLMRFLGFRDSNLVRLHCRSVDFVAFISSTVLNIAHIDASYHRRMRSNGINSGGGVVPDILAHHRLSDRGMMERILECLNTTNSTTQDDSDLISSKTSQILQHLLTIEGDAFAGESYSASMSSASGEGELGCTSNVIDGDMTLAIHIPYYGTVNIERSGVSKSIPSFPTSSEGRTQSTSLPNFSDSDTTVWFGSSLAHQLQSQPDQDPTEPVERPMEFNGDEESFQSDWQAFPSQADEPDGSNQRLVPGLTADTESWALQGVEMAFFDSLFRGSTTPRVE
jgi:hypothetical protein